MEHFKFCASNAVFQRGHLPLKLQRNTVFMFRLNKTYWYIFFTIIIFSWLLGEAQSVLNAFAIALQRRYGSSVAYFFICVKLMNASPVFAVPLSSLFALQQLLICLLQNAPLCCYLCLWTTRCSAGNVRWTFKSFFHSQQLTAEAGNEVVEIGVYSIQWC